MNGGIFTIARPLGTPTAQAGQAGKVLNSIPVLAVQPRQLFSTRDIPATPRR